MRHCSRASPVSGCYHAPTASTGRKSPSLPMSFLMPSAPTPMAPGQGGPSSQKKSSSKAPESGGCTTTFTSFSRQAPGSNTAAPCASRCASDTLRQPRQFQTGQAWNSARVVIVPLHACATCKVFFVEPIGSHIPGAAPMLCRGVLFVRQVLIGMTQWPARRKCSSAVASASAPVQPGPHASGIISPSAPQMSCLMPPAPTPAAASLGRPRSCFFHVRGRAAAEP